jgi:hypothetical protein
MIRPLFRTIVLCVPYVLTACILLSAGIASTANAAPWDPSAQGYSGHKGTTIYVSKLGDNSDGSSWQKAFHSIQAGLSAVADGKGGHTVLVRPDTYVEANLAPASKGAAGAYNVIVGDRDGKLGSGATGWVIIDSGDPEKGFKSWDWWSTIRASSKHWPHGNNEGTFSSIVWDRWIVRNLYTAGGDAGLFWDLTDKSGEEFTISSKIVWAPVEPSAAAYAIQSCVRMSPVSFAAATSSHWTGWATPRPSSSADGKRPCPNFPMRCSRTALWSIRTTPWPYPMQAIAPGPSSSTAA